MPFLTGGLLQQEYVFEVTKGNSFYALSNGRSVATSIMYLFTNGIIECFYALSNGRSVATLTLIQTRIR